MPIDRPIQGVLCCGNISFDIPVWPVEKFEWGTTHWVREIGANVGGNGGNTAFALGKLGARVLLAGVAGSDAHGQQVLASLERAGVDLSLVQTSSLPTNSSICIVHPSGERLFLHQVGASACLTAELVDFERSVAAGCSHFHLANLFALPNIRTSAGALLARARSVGMTTSLDTGWDAAGQWMHDVGPCLPHTDLFFVNETESRMLTGKGDPHEAAASLRRYGASDVLIKLGRDGSMLFTADANLRVESFPVDVVDTTGAGDCFAGGLLAALHRGLPMTIALRFASAVGALSVQSLGSVTGLQSFDETLAWISARHTL